MLDGVIIFLYCIVQWHFEKLSSTSLKYLRWEIAREPCKPAKCPVLYLAVELWGINEAFFSSVKLFQSMSKAQKTKILLPLPHHRKRREKEAKQAHSLFILVCSLQAVYCLWNSFQLVFKQLLAIQHPHLRLLRSSLSRIPKLPIFRIFITCYWFDCYCLLWHLIKSCWCCSRSLNRQP